MIKTAIILTFFTISCAYAHPNHMSFEDIKHTAEQTSVTITDADKVTHSSTEEKSDHGDMMIPCTEQQHRSIPCKKK